MGAARQQLRHHGPVTSSPAVPAAAWARIARHVLQTAYPYASGHVARGPGDTDITPERLHPAFHGALDWHSSVHMQWSLVVLTTRYPDALAAAGELDPARDLLADRLTPEHVAVEVSYLRERPGFERPYGWAWAARLAADAPPPHREALAPVAEVVAEHVLAWLPAQAYPVRHGKHANDAFALRLLHEAFSRLGRDDVVTAVAARAREWFGADTDWDTRDEPGGTDFLSPALAEAELMRQVLPADEAAAWVAAFLPGLGAGRHGHLLQVPRLGDDRDGQLAHLLGLALSRAWQLRALAPLLPPEAAATARAGADAQEAAVRPAITEGDFMATHWLVSFALLAAGEGTPTSR